MSAFVSNGSGSGVYDPVTTTEGFPNGSEVRINDYDDPWYSGFKGGRTYSYGTYRKSGVKSLCEGLRNRTKPRCLLITVIGVVLLMLLVLIIIVAQSHHTSYTADPNQRNTWSKTSIGLNFYPVGSDNSDVFIFSPIDPNTYEAYIKGFTSALKNYDSAFLHNHSHIVCNSTYHPDNQMCQQLVTDFGSECSLAHQFGYHGGRPCILLTFNMPEGYSMRGLVPKDGAPYLSAEKTLKESFSSEDIGVSCEPIPEDRHKVTEGTFNSTVKVLPVKGFPGYLMGRSQQVPPAVMVQFNHIKGSVRSNENVRFTCTAWGWMTNDHGNDVSPTGMFNTTFAFRIL